MEEKSKIKIVAGFDIIVAIGILFVGVLVIIFGMYYNDFITSTSDNISGTPTAYSWISKTPLIVLVSGLVTILYGVKRLIDDLLKIT